MARDPKSITQASETALDRLASRTPARIFVGRSGAGYRTSTELELRGAQAAAADAVRSEFNLIGDLGDHAVRRFQIFEVGTEAHSKVEYLANPSLGRRLGADAKEEILRRC